MDLLEKVFGANWRTTVLGWTGNLSALLAFLLALNEFPGLDEAIRKKVAATAAIVAALMKCLQSIAQKDAAISGNGTVDDPHRKPSTDGERSRLLPLWMLVLLPALALGTGGCAQLQDVELQASKKIGAGKAYVGLSSGGAFVGYRLGAAATGPGKEVLPVEGGPR